MSSLHLWTIFREHTLSHWSVLFASLSVFLICVGYFNGLTFQVLTIHPLYCQVWGVKVVIGDKAKLFMSALFCVSHDSCRDDNPKSGEYIAQRFFIYNLTEIAHEYVGANFLCTFILASFVDFYGLAVEFYHVHYFNCVITIFFIFELDETKSRVLIGYSITRKVNSWYRPTLQKELP